MSNSVRPHRQQPTRLPHPWDSPGKNTGVGCHFLLQCRKVKSESEVVQLCPTRRDPMDCSLPGSSIHGIFQARVLEWGAIAFSGIVLWVVIKKRKNAAKREGTKTPGSEDPEAGWTCCLWGMVRGPQAGAALRKEDDGVATIGLAGFSLFCLGSRSGCSENIYFFLCPSCLQLPQEAQLPFHPFLTAIWDPLFKCCP